MQPTRMSVGAQPIAFFVANVVGAGLYVFAASRGGWAIAFAVESPGWSALPVTLPETPYPGRFEGDG